MTDNKKEAALPGLVPDERKSYWEPNVGHHAGIDIPLEVPEERYRENDSSSACYDQDDYETQQGY